MIIIAGLLRVAPAQRDAYLTAVASATAMARTAPGCLDFAQSPDQLEADRINIYERWESDEHLAAFRARPADGEAPPILDAEVHKYRISAVESP
jgi:quinol monooxygenase YgiN